MRSFLQFPWFKCCAALLIVSFFAAGPVAATMPLLQENDEVEAEEADGVEDEEPNGIEVTDWDLSEEEPESDAEEPVQFEQSHQQTRKFVPEHDGEPVDLSTFRVREDGFIVACVSPRDQDDDDESGFLQIYNPDLELEQEFALPFAPTALDLDSSGNHFVAGSGIVARVSRDGEVELTADSPNMAGVDMDELREEVIEDLEQRNKQMKKIYSRQIEQFEEQIEELEKIDEEERTRRQNSRLERARQNLKSYQEIIDQQFQEIDDDAIERQIRSSGRITGLAVGGEDIFVATSAATGSGYEIHRVNRDLEDPERILKRLSGCCGQMDIHASEGKVYVAENTKFKVGIYDRDGEKISSFGKRLRGDNQGFGSCCNPMNVLCCGNGEILTAESSIGKIKKFNADGDMIAYIGRARIGGGCKHVAFGHDEKRDRYYVQYEDNHEICVLESTASASAVDPELTKFSQQLTGSWQLSGVKTSDSDLTEIRGVGLELKDDGDKVVVADVIENSPAERRSIGIGDQLIGVGVPGERLESTEGMTADEVTDILRGDTGRSIRLRFHSSKNDRKRRLTLNRVRMERLDGDWIVSEPEEDFFDGAGVEAYTSIKEFTFKEDGTASMTMEQSAMQDRVDSSLKWVATQLDDGVLHVDIEGSDEMIMYNLKIKLDGDSAGISTGYSGWGEPSDFRDYERQ